MLRQYLLGQQAEADLSQVEERLMSDGKLFQELLMLEDEVIDQYVRRQMSAEDRISFEKYFLQSPERREKLRFAQALTKYVDRTSANPAEARRQVADTLPSSDPRAPVYSRGPSTSFWLLRKPVFAYALTAALILIVAGVSWMVIRNRQPSGPGHVFEATLLPGGIIREGGEVQMISIPAGTDTVRFHLLLPENSYREYGVLIVSSAGESIWSVNALKAIEISGKKTIEVDVSTGLLPADVYRLKLRGRNDNTYEDFSSYAFRVNR